MGVGVTFMSKLATTVGCVAPNRLSYNLGRSRQLDGGETPQTHTIITSQTPLIKVE